MAEIVQVNTEVLGRAKDISRRGRKATRAEREQVLKDLAFEQEAFKNHWTAEEKLENRAAFDERYEKERAESRRISGIVVEQILFNGTRLSEEEKAEADNYIKENPESVDIAYGFINMISMGINDPEHVTDYV